MRSSFSTGMYLGTEPGWLDKIERVKRKQVLPTVLTTEEVRAVLICLS